MLDFETPFTDIFVSNVKRKLGTCKRSTVLHRKTCPVCGKNLVNLYLLSSSNEYMCKECMDKSAQIHH